MATITQTTKRAPRTATEAVSDPYVWSRSWIIYAPADMFHENSEDEDFFADERFVPDD